MATPTILGAFLGFGVQIYSNAVRKLPLMQSPWQHAVAAGAGAAFGTWLVDFETRTRKDLDGKYHDLQIIACLQGYMTRLANLFRHFAFIFIYLQF